MAFLPGHLLNNISWDFSSPKYVRLEGFTRVAGQLQRELHGDHARWLPDEVVLAVPRLRVLHSGTSVLTLTADRPSGFTAPELLFKLHGALRPSMVTTGRHFLGGLRRSAQVNALHPDVRAEPRGDEALPEPYGAAAPLYVLESARDLARVAECFACVMIKVTERQDPVAPPDWRPAEHIPEDYYA
jgi:hypothetical protein